MTITASPLSGNQPVPYSRLRRMLSEVARVQPGVVGAASFKTTQRATGGANMSVDVAPGDAWCPVTTGSFATATSPSLTHIYSDAIENVAVAASNATNPRIDLVVLSNNDTSIAAGDGTNIPKVTVLTGTPTAGATLDNMSGAPSLPANAIRSSAVLIPAGSTTVVNANIRDRRPWALGALATSTQSGLSGSTTAGAQGIGMRVELNGANAWKVSGEGILTMNTANQALNWGMSAATSGAGYSYVKAGAARAYRSHTTAETIASTALVAPGAYGAAGTMLFAPYTQTTGGVATIDSFQMIVEEIVQAPVNQA